LLDGKYRGESFSLNDINFEQVVHKWIAKGRVTKEKRLEIINWSNNSISGISTTKYFIKIISYVTKTTPDRPLPPWKK